MTERGQSHEVNMAWHSDIVLGREVVAAMAWQSYIMRDSNVVIGWCRSRRQGYEAGCAVCANCHRGQGRIVIDDI